ncbi:MAG: Flp family type IVb pilin [Desulfuromonadales bacterium]|nr:Flp family type IVb pilin [Desulfuromonadales bacterium]
MSVLGAWSARLMRDEEGATATEYAIMIVLILLVAFVAVSLLGGQVERSFNRFNSEFTSVQNR